MQRPYTVPGFGWLLAVVVLIVAALAALGAIAAGPTLILWLIVGLALAVLL